VAARFLDFEILKECGKHPLMLGGRIYVLPFSGRVLGLFPDTQNNVLWTNPKLEHPDSTQKLLTSGEWTNLGGDRTWISPEIELFIKDASRPMDSYKVPPAVDPGNYSIVSQKENEIILVNEMSVNFFRSKCKTSLVLQKRISQLHSPGFTLPSGISAVGYELECTLSAPGNVPGNIRPAIWNLLQVPPGGGVFVPLKNQNPPVHFFGRQAYRQTKDLVSASVPAAQEGYKFSIHADDCCGMMLYLNSKCSKPFMIVRQFKVHNAEEYFDVSFENPKQRGFPQQIYIDNGAFGGFGEMEHHSPAIIPKVRNCVTDISTTWAFTGFVAELARFLLERKFK